MMKAFHFVARRQMILLTFVFLPLLFSCTTPPSFQKPEEYVPAEQYVDTDDDNANATPSEEYPVLAPIEPEPEPEVPEPVPVEEVPLEPELPDPEPEPVVEEPPTPEHVLEIPYTLEPIRTEPIPAPVSEPEPLPEPALPVIPPPTPVAEMEAAEPNPDPQPEISPALPLAVPPPPPPFFAPPERAVPPPAEVPQVDTLPELPGRPLSPPAEEEITLSRIVRAAVGQIVEIPFRGTGWVFLGETENRRGLPYDSRRLDTAAGSAIGQSFIFRTEAAGTYTLRFFRQDFIQDYIINDHVQVIVEETANISIIGALPSAFPADPDRVIAEPRWPPLPGEQAPPPAFSSEPQADSAANGANSALPGDMAAEEPAAATAEGITGQDAAATPPVELPSTVDASPIAALPSAASLPAVPPSSEQVASPADYIHRARAEFDAGRVDSAVATLDEMLQHFPAGTAEALFLLAQLLEANSPSRDIQRSFEVYNRLVNEYPHSNLVTDAQRRIAYLERFFFTIR
ncbi:MAG: hypothetical protein FWD91_07225 [Treponema sp.]|nr:hypothetical protein [Treponema sp.]